ncbi:MAG: glycosyltransferase family 9 protein [Nevskia sp.]|nr:glycosyltransferase family 9 protein [Nevskia sp.]
MPPSLPSPTPPRRVLLLQCRNVGDAVIGTGLVEALGRSAPSLELHVLTRAGFRPLYANSPYVAAVHDAEFPMGSGRRFGAAGAALLLRRVAALRRLRFDRVVNLCGDFRENALGWAIAARGNAGPVWPNGHAQRQHVRQGLTALVPGALHVAADAPGVYAAVQRLAASLGATAPARQRLYDASRQPYLHRPQGGVVGLHPSTSQPCKEWPLPRWKALIGMIREAGHAVVVFGAAAERERLAAVLGGMPGVELATGSMETFFERLSRVAAFVGLDSFGIHAAHAIGVPSLMLNGANQADLVAPPDTLVIDGGSGLPCHPCYSRPSCVAGPRPYACIRDIAEARVMRGLRLLLEGRFPPGPAPKL